MAGAPSAIAGAPKPMAEPAPGLEDCTLAPEQFDDTLTDARSLTD